MEVKFVAPSASPAAATPLGRLQPETATANARPANRDVMVRMERSFIVRRGDIISGGGQEQSDDTVDTLGSASSNDLAAKGAVSGALVERDRHRPLHPDDQRHRQRARLPKRVVPCHSPSQWRT